MCGKLSADHCLCIARVTELQIQSGFCWHLIGFNNSQRVLYGNYQVEIYIDSCISVSQLFLVRSNNSNVYQFQGCRNHGYSGCKCTPCLLHFQLCGCSAGADYGCIGCTKLLQQTELTSLEDVCGGVPPRSRQDFGKVVIHLAKGETESITYGIFIEALRRNCA